MNTTLTIRIDSNLKKEAKATADRLGISLASLVAHDFRELILGRPVVLKDDLIPSPRLQKSIREGLAEYHRGETKTYTSAEALIASLKETS